MMNSKTLNRRCRSDWSELTDGMEIRGGGGRLHAFKDNGASILAVAHTDYVSKTKHFQHLQLDDRYLIYNGQLDDRLGIYTILDVLPALGLKFDILLTDHEEIGQSTAEEFQAHKQYNWMFMFDRRGTDAVTYQYTDKKWLSSLAKHLRIGQGSFSDISMLGHLGCAGVNVGAGYYDEHSSTHYMNVGHWSDQVKRFVGFYSAFHDTRFEHDESKSFMWGGRGRRSAFDDDQYSGAWQRWWERSGWKGDAKTTKEDLKTLDDLKKDDDEDDNYGFRLYCWSCNLWLDEEDAYFEGGITGQNPLCPCCGDAVHYEHAEQM